MGETRFIIECSIEILYEVFKQLQQVGLMGSQHSYIVNSLVSRMLLNEEESIYHSEAFLGSFLNIGQTINELKRR